MRLLLVQVPTSHLGSGERVYPLGLSRLARLIPAGVEPAALDMNLSPDPWPLLQEKLLAFAPRVVALSFRNLDPLAGHQASYLSSLKTAACMVRRLLPAARIWAGGPAFSLFGERLMQEIPEIDCGLRGEGEAAFPQLLRAPQSPQRVPGLIWREGGQLHANPAGSYLDLARLPDLALDLFRPRDYMAGNAYVAAMGIEGKRGCDLQCAYCVYPALGGRKLRLRSPQAIVTEMERLHQACGIRLFHFTDGVLNRPADHFRALCREILQRKLTVQWTGFFRETDLSQETLDLAAAAGLIAVYFSGDALTEHGLTLLNKRLTRADILQAARITAQSGILTMAHFLINLPGETPAHGAEAREMLDRILEIHAPAGNLGGVIFNHVRLYPGAPLTRKLLRSGLLDPNLDLLYPVYHNPPAGAHRLHELESHCHTAGVFSRLNLNPSREHTLP